MPEAVIDILSVLVPTIASGLAAWVAVRWPEIKARATKTETKVDDILVAGIEAALKRVKENDKTPR